MHAVTGYGLAAEASAGGGPLTHVAHRAQCGAAVETVGGEVRPRPFQEREARIYIYIYIHIKER